MSGVIYTDGVPDDVEATHTIAGVGGYYVAMPYQNTRQLIAVLVAVMVVFVIMLVGFAFYWMSTYDTLQIVTPPPSKIPSMGTPMRYLMAGRGVNQTIPYSNGIDGTGISSQMACNGQDESSWTNSRCQCYTPYWGANCQRESYKPQYIPLGDISSSNYTLVGTTSQTTTNLSYLTSNPNISDPSSCTDICDGDATCSGVVWDADSKTCTTFTDAAIASSYTVKIDPNVDSNFFVKKSRWDHVDLRDRIMLYSSDPIRPEWWLRSAEQEGSFFVVRRGIRSYVPFYPMAQHNNGLLHAVYALYPFNASEFNALVAAGSTDEVYVFRPGDVFFVPLAWADQQIWCMYQFYP